MSIAACLKQSSVEAFEGDSEGTEATSTRGSTVQVCPIAPGQRYKALWPVWKTGLGIGPAVVAVRASLDRTTTPRRPRAVTATAGNGNDAAPEGAH